MALKGKYQICGKNIPLNYIVENRSHFMYGDVKGKLKLSLCLSKYHAMKTY